MIRRRLLALGLLAAALIPSAGAAETLPTKTWVGAFVGDWNVPTNWSPAGVPGPSDHVDLGFSAAITLAGADATVASALNRSSGALIVDDARLTLTGGHLGALGGVSVKGGGSLVVQGTASLGSIALGEAGPTPTPGTLLVGGGAELHQPVREVAGGLGAIRISPGGSVTVPAGSRASIQGALENDGSLAVGSDFFLVATSVDPPASDGSFTVGSGSTLDLVVGPHGTFVLSPTSAVAGAGLVRVRRDTSQPGTLHVEAGAAFAPRSVEVWGSAGLKLDADATLSEFDVASDGSNARSRFGTGMLLVTGPEVSTVGMTRFTDAGTTIFAGPLHLSGGSVFCCPFAVGGGARLVTRGPSQLLSGALVLGDASGPGTWENEGQLRLFATTLASAGAGGVLRNLAGGTITQIGAASFGALPIENAGTVGVEEGSLGSTVTTDPTGPLVQSGGTTIVHAGAFLNRNVTLNGGSLSGAGTVKSVVNDGGTVEPGMSTGTLTIANTFTQTAGGTLRTEIDGAAAFDRLAVGGTAAVGGTLAVVSNPLFTPDLDDEFRILTGTPRVGQFGTVSGDQAGLRRYLPQYRPTEVALCVVEGAATRCGQTGPLAPPANVVGTNVSRTGFTVGWSASPDGRVTRYAVSVGGTPRGETTATSLELGGLVCGTAYEASVRALDGAGGSSPAATATISTLPCPLAQPTGLHASEQAPTSLTLSWTASPDPRTVRYEVLLGGVSRGETTGTQLTIGDLACGTVYAAAVRALDGLGEASEAATANISTSACALPLVTGLAATALGQTSITLTWTPSLDPRVRSYAVFRDGVLVGRPLEARFNVPGLACGTTYQLSVRARSLDGDESQPATLALSTLACAIGPPTELTARGIGETSLTLSWTPSADSRVVRYAIFRDNVLLAETDGTTAVVRDLACGTPYEFAVRARDGAGNDSVPLTITVTAAACTIPPPPPLPDAPRNLEPPSIEPGANGTYTCTPGRWAGLASAKRTANGPTLLFSWLRIAGEQPTLVGDTPSFRPKALDTARHVCRVEARNPGGTKFAISPSAMLLGSRVVELGPPYGNFVIRGIDVVQAVQPLPGAGKFRWPVGGFTQLPGAGTPTSFRPNQNGRLVSENPQRAIYEGVSLDATKPTQAWVYANMWFGVADDPSLQLEVSLVGRRGGRQLGRLTKYVANPAVVQSPVVGYSERFNVAFGTWFDVPAAWLAGGELDFEATVAFPFVGKLFSRRQCDDTDTFALLRNCAADDTFRLVNVPVFRMPELRVATLALDRLGAPAQPDGSRLPGGATVLKDGVRLFPGGELMRINSLQGLLLIDSAAILKLDDEACKWAKDLKDVNDGQRLRRCRQQAVGAMIRQWAIDNPGSGANRFDQPYDLLFGVHDYDGRDGVKEPGWNSGDISQLPLRPGAEGSRPYFTATAFTRPITAAAHELGHHLTLPHTDGCSAANPEAWPPDFEGRLQGVKVKFDPGSAPSAVSFDGRPATNLVYDVMSYCAKGDDAKAWVSANSWDHALLSLRNFANRRAVLAAAPQATLFARPVDVALGQIGPTEGAIVRVFQADGTSAPPPVAPRSPIRLRAFDGGGRLLREVGVELEFNSESEGDGGASFAAPVPSGATRLELIRDGRVLDAVARSARPAIRVLAPTRGQLLGAGRELVVRWQAVDPDGGPVDASVDFSGDGGSTWRTVSQGRSRGSARIPGSYFERTNRARIRVTVNDGFNETAAVSAVFRTTGSPPTARILRPAVNEQVAVDGRTLLIGSATDDAKQPLRGRALTWYVGKRRLGHGERRLVRALAPGRHTVRLVARDASGRTTAASVRVRVAAALPRFLMLEANRIVRRSQRAVAVRVRVSTPATLLAGGRRYRVTSATRRIEIPLPARPTEGLIRLRLELRAATGRAHGAVELIRIP